MNKSGIYSELHDKASEEKIKMAKGYMPYIYEDARSYKDAIKRNDYNKAVADAEQVAEKSVKAIATKNGKLSNTLKGKNGHNMRKLVTECGCNDINVSQNDLDRLTKSYFNSRYPEGKKKYNIDEAEEIGVIAFKLMDKAVEELDIPYDELEKELGINESPKNINDLSTYRIVMNGKRRYKIGEGN